MMDKNPYDNSIDWLPPQSPASRQGSIYTSRNQPGPTQPTAYYQAQDHASIQPAIKKAASTKQARMPKQRALEMVDALKKGIVISSVVSFGLLGLLATGHAVGTTSSNTKTATPVTSSKSSPTTTPSTSNSSGSSSSSSSGNSSSSNNSSSSSSSSSSTSQGGFSFGSSSSQGSVSGTSVS